MLHDVLEEFTSTNILHYHEYICRSADHLISITHIIQQQSITEYTVCTADPTKCK